MATKIQVRRDTAANWTSANPTLSDGEIGYETDTGYMKIGDGTTAWASLGYFVDADDANTTYTISAAQATDDANITLTGSDTSTDTITLVAGTNMSLTVAGDNITAAVDTDLSNYDNTTSAFLTSATLDLSGESLGSLSDVDIPSPSTNDYLQYDGANWVAGAPAVIAADDLSDVSTTGAASGHHLLYDGANYISTYNFSSSGTTFQSGFKLDRYIEHASETLTIGSISAGDSVDFPTVGAGRAAHSWRVNNPGVTNFTANFTPGPSNIDTSMQFRIIVDNTSGSTKAVIDAVEFNGVARTVYWSTGSTPVQRGDAIEDVFEFNVFRGTGGSDAWIYAEHVTRATVQQGDTFDGDVTGSVFGDDSTLLVDGVNNKIPSANLEGALPALDGSNLTGVTAGSVAFADITSKPTTVSGYGITDALVNISEDTNPSLGGGLDMNGNEITGTGNINMTNGNLTITTGNIAVNNGDVTVSGGDLFVTGSNNDLRLQNASVSGAGQVIANFKAEVSGTEYNTVAFKSGPDNFADNGEVTWSTRIQGALTEVFEIKGSTTGRSGFTINPDSSAEIDTIIAGGTDGFLLTVNAGNDKVGIGKDPTQGILDVDGDVYATNFQGNLTGNVGNFSLASSVIDTDDSSAITVTPATVFSSDVTVENGLVVNDTIKGVLIPAAGTAPTVATDPGQTGEIRFDDNYIYIKTSAGWKRAALSGLV
jgi:hypothetical protein